MTAQEIVDHYGEGSVYEAAKAIDVTPAVIYIWLKNGVPEGRQAILQIKSKGKLKAGPVVPSVPVSYG